MPIVLIGLSHRTARVELREKFAFAEPTIPAALQSLRDSGLAREAVILSTCNRVEVYVATEQPGAAAAEGLRKFLQEKAGGIVPTAEEFYTFEEPLSLEHLFKVASGLDSMVLGETEILGQLKKAYDLALQAQQTGARLNKAFQNAFNVSKHIRTHTNIQRGSVSVSSVAVELAEKIFSTLSDRQVMVIGAGDTSEKAARALLSRGAHSVMVSNRSFDRAEALAKELNGRAIRFEDWDREFRHVDIVISSTSAPHYILDRAKLKPLMTQRDNRPLLLIDIAVPRDIEPEISSMDDVYLYNVDDLQAIASDYMRQRKEEIASCEEIIRAKVKKLLENTRPMRIETGNNPAFSHE